MAKMQPRGVVDIQREIESVEGKDTRLWSTFLILFLVMAAAFHLAEDFDFLPYQYFLVFELK